jgi:hypothetical protein
MPGGWSHGAEWPGYTKSCARGQAARGQCAQPCPWMHEFLAPGQPCIRRPSPQPAHGRVAHGAVGAKALELLARACEGKGGKGDGKGFGGGGGGAEGGDQRSAGEPGMVDSYSGNVCFIERRNGRGREPQASWETEGRKEGRQVGWSEACGRQRFGVEGSLTILCLLKVL